MSVAFTVKILKDEVTPAMEELSRFATSQTVKNRMAEACVRLTRSHLLANGTNKQNWPTTGFYPAVARDGVTATQTANGFDIAIDHPEKPGAMRQRFYGGVINMKDKLLTIPARQEFYGHGAREFSNLRFGMFRTTGTKFLYIAPGGTSRVSAKTGRTTTKGTGARAAMMIAYWLKESVEQDADPDVIPTEDDYGEVVLASLYDTFDQWKAKKNSTLN